VVALLYIVSVPLESTIAPPPSIVKLENHGKKIAVLGRVLVVRGVHHHLPNLMSIERG
jgi:hypothetical protein